MKQLCKLSLRWDTRSVADSHFIVCLDYTVLIEAQICSIIHYNTGGPQAEQLEADPDDSSMHICSSRTVLSQAVPGL